MMTSKTKTEPNGRVGEIGKGSRFREGGAKRRLYDLPRQTGHRRHEGL